MDTVDVEEEELEAVRKARVKQLEEMVLQLERENKKLLNKVTESADKYKEEASSVKERRSERLQHATSLDELISLDGDITNANDDEWLFVSPAKPPTPSQKQVTPSQWLAKCGVTEMTGEDTPFSLDDVRKDLSFQISNAESMSPSNMKKSIGRGGGGGTVSPLTSRRQLSNPTAQKYLNQVRGRRTSPPVEAVTPPSTRRLYQPHNTTTGASAGEEDVIPIVKWKKPVLPQDSPSPTPEETIPVVRWKKPVLPTSEQPSPPPEDEFVPVVRWKRPVVPQTTPPESPQDEEEQTVPIVRWRKPVIPQDELQPPEEPVPVVQWRRPVVPNDDIHTNNSEDVPNVTWKPPRGYKNTPIKAIATTRSPPEGEEDNIEYRQGQSNTLPRPSSRRPVGARGGLRPPGKTGLSSPSSPQYRPRNASAERPVTNSLRSRSPSPSSSGHYQPIRVGSRSPSPGTHHEHRSPHTSPMATRLSPRRNPQQNTSSLQPPVKSPSAPGSKHLSPGGPPRGRGISGTISAPSTGQRVASSPLTGLQTMTTPPRTARARGHSSPQRGGLSQTTPPHNDPGSLIRPARYSAAPQSRQKNKHSSPQRQEVRVQDEDWLEGCY